MSYFNKIYALRLYYNIIHACMYVYFLNYKYFIYILYITYVLYSFIHTKKYSPIFISTYRLLKIIHFKNVG